MPKTAAVSAANTNWGLSFQENGKTPTGNATPEFLKQYGAYFVGPTASSGEAGEQKTIYLTFDAGFENGNTPAILDALKAHNAKACFFLVGNYLETSPELVKRMVEEGHTVGNHTYHHPDMSKIADEESFRRELTLLEDAYRELTGQEMTKFYRPPQGKYSEQNLKMANDMGYHTFSGVSPTSTGTPTSSPPGSRRSTSCFPASIRGDRAAAQHLERQRRDPRRAAEQMGGLGLHLRHPGRTGAGRLIVLQALPGRLYKPHHLPAPSCTNGPYAPG